MSQTSRSTFNPLRLTLRAQPRSGEMRTSTPSKFSELRSGVTGLYSSQMKPLRKNQRRRNAAALTLIEVLVVIAIVVVLLGLFLPALARAKHKSSRIGCVNNLKQIGLAFRMWSPDQSPDYPMLRSTNHSGTLEVASEAWRTFQILSNEINEPKVLICPQDTKRVAATNWSMDLKNGNISYFVGLDAREELPNLILSGDRNLTNGQPLQNQVMTITSSTPVGWTSEIHVSQGNIGLTDGSVQQVSSAALRKYVDSALSALDKDGPNFRPPVTNGLLRLALP